MPRRMIETNITEEDIKLEGSLRPQTLDDYIGQSKIKENLKVYIPQQSSAEMHWTMCCSMDLPDWARPRWQES